LIDEKKVSLIASTHGGVEALATGSVDSSASTNDIQLIMNLNLSREIEFLTRCARDAYDVLLHFVFTPIAAKSASQRWLGGWQRYWTECWTGDIVVNFIRALARVA
jgi:hypothetical protein